MKHLIIGIVIITALSTISNAQCKAKLKMQMEKYCEGEYLHDYEIKYDYPVKLKMVLRNETVYGIYLFKDENGAMPNLVLYNKKNIPVKDYLEVIEKANYKYYKLKTPSYGAYKFKIAYNEGESGCALLALYSQAESKSMTISFDARDKNK